MAQSDNRVGLDFEKWVRQSLKRIGFKSIGGGPKLIVGGHQIDACGGWDDVLLVAECTQSTMQGASIHSRISELRGKVSQIRSGFRKTEGYEDYRRFEFAIITRGVQYSEGDRVIADEKPRIHLIDDQVLTYYQKLTPVIGEQGARFNLLGELNVKPREFDLPRLPAFKARLKSGLSGYLFWCAPHDLLKVAYVARRESGREQYYQRMLKPARIKKIRKFIDDQGVFPNNVIICFDDKPTFRTKPEYEGVWPSWLEFGELVFPNSYRSCWIIDGQHRLYGFGRGNPNPKAQKLAVFAFEPMKKDQQAKYFIEINKEQEEVSKDLIWDLVGEMRPDTDPGRIANCVRRLNSMQPLSGTISMPLSGDHKRGQLKMSGVCQDIEETSLAVDDLQVTKTIKVKNPLVHGRNKEHVPDIVAKAVSEFLDAVKSEAPEEIWQGIILRPGGLRVVLNVYQQILVRIEQEPSDNHLQKYAHCFIKVLKELAPNKERIREIQRTYLTSYAQRRELSLDALAEMQDRLGDPDYGKIMVTAAKRSDRLIKFERTLAELVCLELEISSIQELKHKAPEGVWKEAENLLATRRKADPEYPVHKVLGIGHTRDIIVQKNNWEKLKDFLANSGSGFSTKQEVEVALGAITKTRNPKLHGGLGGNNQLTKAFLDIFDAIFDSW